MNLSTNDMGVTIKDIRIYRNYFGHFTDKRQVHRYRLRANGTGKLGIQIDNCLGKSTLKISSKATELEDKELAKDFKEESSGL